MFAGISIHFLRILLSRHAVNLTNLWRFDAERVLRLRGLRIIERCRRVLLRFKAAPTSVIGTRLIQQLSSQQQQQRRRHSLLKRFYLYLPLLPVFRILTSSSSNKKGLRLVPEAQPSFAELLDRFAQPTSQNSGNALNAIYLLLHHDEISSTLEDISTLTHFHTTLQNESTHSNIAFCAKTTIKPLT